MCFPERNLQCSALHQLNGTGLRVRFGDYGKIRTQLVLGNLSASGGMPLSSFREDMLTVLNCFEDSSRDAELKMGFCSNPCDWVTNSFVPVTSTSFHQLCL